MESALASGDHIRRKEVHCAASLAATASWSAADGASVDARQVVGTVGAIEHGNLQQLLAPARGTFRILTREQLETLLAHANGEADGGDESNGNGAKPAATVPIAYVEYCIHPLMNGRTCMMCLALVDENEDELDDERRSVNVVSHGQMLRLNVEEAKKFDSANIKRQLDKQKLSLVLDLDHTLLHAVRVEDLTGEVPKSDDIHFFYIPGLPNQHVVKLRPHLSEFLEELSVKYDLFIYTHGTRTYAEQIARIIDPDDKFFQHRIVARTDTPDMLHKSLKLLFPSSDDSMILVLDDRIDVWKENESNVFLIEPYHYFNSTREINNASGSGVLEFEEGSASDDHLCHAKRVLTEVHAAFYGQGSKSITVEDQMSGKGGDVKRILTEHKKTILTGCNIVFSGLFPLQGPRKPESHYLWRLAVELGATASMTMENFPMTHLVIHPGRLETQKHNQARAMPGVVVVVPEWMLKSARIWKRAPETDFLADEWKAKLARHAAQKKAAAEAAVAAQAAAAAPPSSPNPDNTTENEAGPKSVEGNGGEECEEKGVTPESTQPNGAPTRVDRPPPVPILMKESRVVHVADNADDNPPKEKKKSVTFSAEVDEAETQRALEAKKVAETNGAPSGTLSTGPRRPLRRVIGGRPVAVPRVPENRGVVASGGTFDFLSKISQLGATKRPAAPPVTAAPTPAPAPPAAPTAPVKEPAKDIDDAFLRLIEAEEEETAQEQKRKRSSTDLKDQLANRRLKREKTGTASAQASSNTTENGGEEEEDDEDLDDLEAEFLDDL